MSPFSRDGHERRRRRDDDLPYRPDQDDRRPPAGDFNDERQPRHNNWRNHRHERRRPEYDTDSTYGSGVSGPTSNPGYQRTWDEDNRSERERNEDKIADLTSQLRTANDKTTEAERVAKECRQASDDYLRDLETERESHGNSKQDNDRLGRENDWLRLALGKQYLRNESWQPAIEVLDPLVDRRRATFQASCNDRRCTEDQVDEARSSLHQVELIYSKALSHTDKEADAVVLLNDIFWEGYRQDRYIHSTEARDAQQHLCCLLEKSTSTKDWDKALKIVDIALRNAWSDTAGADLPWIIENRLLRTKVLVKLKYYSEVLPEAQLVWNERQSVPRPLQKSIERGMINIFHELQQAGRHRDSVNIMLMTMAANNGVSDATIQSIASLGSRELFETWEKCSSVLQTSEGRRVGWELAARLKGGRRNADAVKVLTRLPPGSTPSQDQVNDLLSRLLLEHVELADHEKAAGLAAASLAKRGFVALDGNSACYHVKTLLGAVGKMSRAADGRGKLAGKYKDIYKSYWLPVFAKAKDEPAQRANLDGTTLNLLASTGKDLRERWRDNAQEKKPKTTKGWVYKEWVLERNARDALKEKVEIVEGWVAQQK